MSKPNLLDVTTPPGTLSLVWLTQPSQYGKYQASITLTMEDAAPIITEMEAMRDKDFAIRDLQGDDPVDEFQFPFKVDEDANEVTFKFRCASEKKNHKTNTTVSQRPVVVDSQKQPLDAEQFIGAGSRARLKGVAYLTYRKNDAGSMVGYLSIKLKAAQILELATSNYDAAADFDVEEGYDMSANFDA